MTGLPRLFQSEESDMLVPYQKNRRFCDPAQRSRRREILTAFWYISLIQSKADREHCPLTRETRSDLMLDGSSRDSDHTLG
jgi:hypothetical protein